VGLGIIQVLTARGQSSVLQSGNWFKVSVEKRGIYKITADQFKRMGFGIGIDPRKIKLFGNEGGMLPQSNSASRPVDLTENAIFISGEADGSFDKEDYILFFAEGPDRVHYDLQRQIFAYENNLYSDKNFYFFTVGADDGKRISTVATIDGNFPTVEQFDDYVYHELDEKNILSSGREWFGERFDVDTDQTFSVPMLDVVANSPIKFVSDVMGQSFASSSFKLSWNNTPIGDQVIPTIPNTQYGSKGAHKKDTIVINSNAINAAGTTEQQIQYQYIKSGNSTAYLDFFLVNVKRVLRLSDHQLIFRAAESVAQPVSQYKISAVSDRCTIWNVTEPYFPKQQLYNLQQDEAIFSSQSNELNEYIIFDDDIPSPELVGKIDNQNLHGMGAANLIVISHPDFLAESQRLAAHRSAHNGWSTLVVTPDQIYLEFSSGRQDVSAIRDFVKHVYNKDPSSVKAVLLMGKGSYDYKNRIEQNTNFVPTYESRNSLAPLATYSSDDYFAFLDTDEGNWGESPVQNHTSDIGVGRLPVKSFDEAKNVVDKIIDYDLNKKKFGRWRKDIAFVGDDGSNADNFTSTHQSQANSIAESIEANHPEFDTKKIFLGKYVKTVRPNGESIPDVNKDIVDRFDRGSLIINFTGHGNEKQWTDENVFSDTEISTLKNKLYPFLVTATCEFGRQDDPTVVSSAELSVLRPSSGAIGLVTTARPVNAGTNFVLNQEFYKAMFEKESSRYKHLGEIFKDTKNNSTSGVANRNFSLLGDPSMTLAMPMESVQVTSIKTSSGSDTLKALSTVVITGEVQNESGGVVDDFNGVLEVTLFDKKVDFITVGKNNPPFQFNEWYNALYRGKGSVKNGVFELEFVLTKNIVYEIGNGKLSLYASDAIKALDAGGSITSFKIGGSEPGTVADNTSPDMQVFLGDTTFVNGGIVSPNTTLIVRLEDNSGINISGYGVGNGLIAQLDNDSQIYNLNDYYEAYMDDFTLGYVYFPLNGLSPGRHSITVKAWDTHNNPVQQTLEFIVSDGDQLVIETFGNSPNPFEDETSIFFTHNRSGDDLQAQLIIYSQSGQQLKTYQFEIPSSPYHVDLAKINDLYDFQKKLPGGLYLARLAVRSLTNGSKNERVTKLIVVN
jgi:hypothetical protein